jgi:hypothetical protein
VTAREAPGARRPGQARFPRVVHGHVHEDAVEIDVLLPVRIGEVVERMAL